MYTNKLLIELHWHLTCVNSTTRRKTNNKADALTVPLCPRPFPQTHIGCSKQVAVHLRNPPLPVNIARDVGGVVLLVRPHLLRLGEPQGGKCADICYVHHDESAHFVAQLRVLGVESGQDGVAANEVPAWPHTRHKGSQEGSPARVGGYGLPGYP